mmetsp:Transcript_72420/g.143809  ORF Transcript_72420/g.143809 Transcript_72420/m.143809 type:complete len:242 (-) Transcript_72420:416-1141(-)
MRLESSKDDTAPTIAWVVGAGGDGTDEGLAIALDHSPSSTGGAYITGYFHGNASFVGAPSAPATVLAGVAAPSGVKTQDAFVAHVDSTGAFTFAVEVGGQGSDYGKAIAAKTEGDYVYVMGNYQDTITVTMDSPDSPSTSLSSLSSSLDATNTFFMALDQDGGIKKTTKIGGDLIDHGLGLAMLDTKGATSEPVQVLACGQFHAQQDSSEIRFATANNGDDLVFASSGMGDAFMLSMTIHG